MNEGGLDIQTIYKYDTHRNVPWNITEYQPLREYLDPGKIMSDRARQQGAKTERYITRKVGFLDQHIKNLKDMPAPGKYQYESEFDQTLNKKQSKKHKIDFKLKKNTYLQQIESIAKIYKPPGVGKYNLRRQSQSKSTKKKHSIDQKRFFYEDNQFLSTSVPGSGCYYPHDEVSHVKEDRTNPDLWIDKHKKQKEKNRKRALKEADPGTYRPVSANTFDRHKLDHQKNQKRVKKDKPSHGFGCSDSKFTYTRTKKSLGETRPDPCNYNTMIEWKGKKQDARKNNWVRCLSAGPTRSVYQH